MTVTTLKVSTETRDRVKALTTAQHRTADQILMQALDALEAINLKLQARQDAERLAADSQDAAEMRRVMEDMEELRAW